MNKIKCFRHLFFKKGMLPIYLIFGATYKCNSACRTCFNWQSLNKLERDLDINEIKSIMNNFNQIMNVVISGGEPFLRNDVVDICEIFYKQNHVEQITIPTNGILTSKIFEFTKNILSIKGPEQKLVINLSIDGIAEKHDYIRGVDGNFQKVLDIYQKLVTLKEKDKSLILNVHTLLCSYNKENIMQIMHYVKNYMPEIAFHSFELLRGSVPDKNIRSLNATEFAEILSRLKNYWLSFDNCSLPAKVLKMYARNVELSTLTNERRTFDCYAGSISGVIDAVGNVQLCEVLDPVGNLRENNYDFKKIWFSEQADAQRLMIRNRGCWCTHSCFVSSSLPFSYRAYPGLCNTYFNIVFYEGKRFLAKMLKKY